ncbi:hypothetical protein NW754_009013 [Fusarium falciforme]|nr:hypothetical protein NW754_009013 [Fusarium falciforme]
MFRVGGWQGFRHRGICRAPPSHRSNIVDSEYVKIAAARRKLLEKIYKPFQGLEKNGPEYRALGKSGLVWEEYFRPYDSQGYGYTRIQEDAAITLREIDALKDAMRVPANILAKRLVEAYAHQSVAIEDNHLIRGESIVLDDHLRSNFLTNFDLASLSPQELKDLALPDVSFLVPNADKLQVTELRNHLVASRWISETSLRAPGTSGLNENEVRYLSSALMKDLNPWRKGCYPPDLGPSVLLGDYRKTPLTARSNRLAVFPYPVEVPACIKRFFEWRQRIHDEKQLHPLIIACQTVAYFLHIHPFPDGNGRTSRIIMHDYLLRHGYVPIVFSALERADYLRMIKDAQNRKPDEFANRVLVTQLEILRAYQSEEF